MQHFYTICRTMFLGGMSQPWNELILAELIAENIITSGVVVTIIVPS
jgi:hypothetical protein